jgi:2-polyprenyl-3-methyl-5-hydroxy-6-metoxy-1,4-benzoquinol methylase
MPRAHPATATPDAGAASPSPLQACSLCRGAAARYFAYVDEAGAARALHRCRVCGLLQTWPLPSDAELRAWYQRYDVLGQRDSYYAWVNTADPLATPEGRELAARLALVQRHVRSTSPRLLEVGSGHGFFLSLAKRAGFVVVGVELNAAAAQASRERFGVDVHAGTIDSVGLAADSFDVAVLWDLLEHVRDPAGLLAQVRRCLRPGGLLFVETPDTDSLLDLAVVTLARLGWSKPGRLFYGLHHLTLFNRRNLRQLLQAQGFALEALRAGSTRASQVFRRRSLRDRVLRVAVACVQFVGWLVRRQNKMLAVARRS